MSTDSVARFTEVILAVLDGGEKGRGGRDGGGCPRSLGSAGPVNADVITEPIVRPLWPT